jgi:hypothetical protein
MLVLMVTPLCLAPSAIRIALILGLVTSLRAVLLPTTQAMCQAIGIPEARALVQVGARDSSILTIQMAGDLRAMEDSIQMIPHSVQMASREVATDMAQTPVPKRMS